MTPGEIMLSEEKELDSVLTEGDILILVNKLHSSVNSYGYCFFYLIVISVLEEHSQIFARNILSY